MRHGCKRHRRFCGAQGSPPVYERSCVIRDCETLFRRIISGLCLIWPISCIRSRRQRLRHAAGFILSAQMGKSTRSCKTILPLKTVTGRMFCQQATAGESLFQTLNVLNKSGKPAADCAVLETLFRFLNEKAVLFFSRYESVETSRLHGHILSSLRETEYRH